MWTYASGTSPIRFPRWLTDGNEWEDWRYSKLPTSSFARSVSRGRTRGNAGGPKVLNVSIALCQQNISALAIPATMASQLSFRPAHRGQVSRFWGQNPPQSALKSELTRDPIVMTTESPTAADCGRPDAGWITLRNFHTEPAQGAKSTSRPVVDTIPLMVKKRPLQFG